jgi:formate-dependent nitrite reductase membrane component NrfD
MITAFLVVSYLIGLATLADELRRPASAWAAADRNRSWWISTTILLGIFACGLFIGIAYLIGVVPNFGQHDGVDDAFRKRP